MKVVILCGGQGTRFREETEYRPKPLVEVGGRPILWHIMKLYAHHGHRDFVLCLGYRGSMIKEYFLNYEAMMNDFIINLGSTHSVAYLDAHGEQNFNVTLTDTGLNTMTGGRVKRAGKYISDDTFMVTYGDGVSNVDVGKLLKFHSHGKLATMTTVRPVSRFWCPVTADGLILRRKATMEGWINAGFFVFNRRVFDYLGGEDCILESEPLERFAAEKQVMAYKHDGFSIPWTPIAII